MQTSNWWITQTTLHASPFLHFSARHVHHARGGRAAPAQHPRCVLLLSFFLLRRSILLRSLRVMAARHRLPRPPRGHRRGSAGAVAGGGVGQTGLQLAATGRRICQRGSVSPRAIAAAAAGRCGSRRAPKAHTDPAVAEYGRLVGVVVPALHRRPCAPAPREPRLNRLAQPVAQDSRSPWCTSSRSTTPRSVAARSSPRSRSAPC